MLVLYVVIFILSSQIIHAVAVNQQTGFNPYPLGSTLLCMIQHPLLLTMSIYYLGWLWGIAIFLCHFFGIVHMTVSWVFSIPTLLAKDYDRIIQIKEIELALLSPMFIIVLVFTVVSFFVAQYKSLLLFLQNNISILIISSIVIVILSIARIIVAKKVSSNM